MTLAIDRFAPTDSEHSAPRDALAPGAEEAESLSESGRVGLLLPPEVSSSRELDLEDFAAAWSARSVESSRVLTAAPEAAPRPLDPPPDPESLVGWPLEQFARSSLVVEIHSEVLGDKVRLAGEEALLDPEDEPLTVYRASELEALVGLGVSELQRLHRLKGRLGLRLAPALTVEDAAEIPIDWLSAPPEDPVQEEATEEAETTP